MSAFKVPSLQHFMEVPEERLEPSLPEGNRILSPRFFARRCSLPLLFGGFVLLT